MNGDWAYKSCQARLSGQYLSITMRLSADIGSKRNESLKEILDRFDAIMIGDSSWVIRTTQSPRQVVEIIRRYLQGNDYVHVFTLCSDLAWAGPYEACQLFEQIGIVPDQCDELPDPVDPSLE